MSLVGNTFTTLNTTATILEVLRSDDETDIDGMNTNSGGEAGPGTSSDTVYY